MNRLELLKKFEDAAGGCLYHRLFEFGFDSPADFFGVFVAFGENTQSGSLGGLLSALFFHLSLASPRGKCESAGSEESRYEEKPPIFQTSNDETEMTYFLFQCGRDIKSNPFTMFWEDELHLGNVETSSTRYPNS